ncbi:MAG TPA: hypothetical protein DET40_18875 [Lentisphaeria bacterium]|nr:MAG: hypothetical protein A2X45_25490 [Lentisphaerae bacterium GWF2_50_93]HCE45610.1 hypothetical protein [Lentisphaeria bacterium]
MRYAIISDLHANKPALKSVLADIASHQIDQILCLGDVVGYGPNPAEVLELAYSKIHYFILGNHDAVIGGKLSPDNFNDNAKRLIDWTNRNLDGKAAKFFNTLPLDAKGDNFRCAHAEFANPGRFGYIFDPADAEESFKTCPEQLFFVGHSHVPGIFVMGESRVAHWLDPMDFGIEDEKRYIVNVGSVGQPRDDGIRACYCIYDTEQKDVLFKKVAFDIEEYIGEQKKNRIPEAPTYFIDIYHKQAPRPIRDIVDFHRVSAEKSVKTEIETVDLHKTVAKLRKTKRVLLSLLLICAAVLFILLFGYSYQKSAAEKARSEIKKLQKTSYGSLVFSREKIPARSELPMEFPNQSGPVSEASPILDWLITSSDPSAQKISVEKLDNQNFLRISSGSAGEISVSSKSVPVEKGMKFNASCLVMGENFTSGNLEILMEQQLPDGTRKTVYLAPIERVKNISKWKKTTIPSSSPKLIQESGSLFITVRGQFKGDVMLRKFCFKRFE